MSFFNSLGRSMARNPRPPKRSPTGPNFYQDAGALPLPGAGDAYNVGAPMETAPIEPAQKPLYLCNPFVKAALVKGSFKTIVRLPNYVDVNEWVAVNIYEFYNNLNLFYGVLAESCTSHSCPTMSAGPALDYRWIDQNRKQVKLPAPTYIDYVMSWVQQTLDNPKDFPTKISADFAPTFPTTAKHIYRQLLRVFAHLYHAHYNTVLHLSSEGHFNSLFAHFLAFGRQYDLLDAKDIHGGSGGAVGVGELWEKWKEMGVLEA